MDDDVAWWVIPVIGDVQYNLVPANGLVAGKVTVGLASCGAWPTLPYLYNVLLISS